MTVCNVTYFSSLQVFTVGIGNVYLQELKTIASDPDLQHIFLLNSFKDAPYFADFLSYTTCESKQLRCIFV